MRTFNEIIKEWDEDKHPRDEEGKFTSAGSSAGSAMLGTNDPKTLARVASPKEQHKAWGLLNDRRAQGFATAGLGLAAVGGTLLLLRRGLPVTQLKPAFTVPSVVTSREAVSAVDQYASKAIFKEAGEGADQVANVFKTALTRLPEEHVAQLRERGVTFVALNNTVEWNAISAGMKAKDIALLDAVAAGGFNPGTNSVVASSGVFLRGVYVPFKQERIERTVYHEIAHALEFMGGASGKFSVNNVKFINAIDDGVNSLPADVKAQVMTYYIKNYGSQAAVAQEFFADLYAVKHMANVGKDVAFIGETMTKRAVETHFAKALKIMDDFHPNPAKSLSPAAQSALAHELKLMEAVRAGTAPTMYQPQTDLIRRLKGFEENVRAGRTVPFQLPAPAPPKPPSFLSRFKPKPKEPVNDFILINGKLVPKKTSNKRDTRQDLFTAALTMHASYKAIGKAKEHKT